MNDLVIVKFQVIQEAFLGKTLIISGSILH